MNETIYVSWGGHHVKLTWLPEFYPDILKITSVHGYCFDNDQILLVHVIGRGFNIPGGHLEENETPEEAFRREVYEEGYVKGDIQFLGSIEISHEDNSLFDPKGKYPLIGYQVFYRMDIKERLAYRRENEATARIWVEPSEVPFVLNDHQLALKVLKKAMCLS